MEDKKPKKKIEIILTDSVAKEFEKIKYILNLKEEGDVIKHCCIFFLDYLSLVEKGYDCLLPAQKVENQFKVMLDANGNASYLSLPPDDLERFKEWKQIQDIYKEIDKKKED